MDCYPQAAIAVLASHRRRQTGVALILVVFIIALAGIIVVNLAHSTFISARLNSSTERGLQAEYLLKSALNLARFLIMLDTTAADRPDDPWAYFRNGIEIPPEWIGISQPNLRVKLEIRPEGAKIPLRALVSPSGMVDRKWRRVLTTLFKDVLKFDEDKEEDHTGFYPGEHFSSEQMVANLIDYIDADSESYEDPEYPGKGREKDEVLQNIFPNREIMRSEELAGIPGFTPARVQKLLPLVTAQRVWKVNINAAPESVLKSLHPNITDDNVRKMVDFRENKEQGPFEDGGGLYNQLESVGLDQAVISDIASLVQGKGDLFQVIAKVDYLTSSYFLRAFVQRQSALGGLPQILSVELY